MQAIYEQKTFKILWRIIFYLVGLMTISFGTVLTVKSNMGVSAGASLPTVVSSVTNLSLGTCYTVFLLILILLQYFLLGKDFQKLNLLQIFSSLIFGVFTDLSMAMLVNVEVANFLQQSMVLLISILLQGIGIALYIDTNIIPMSPDGLLLALSKKLPKVSLGNVKLIEDCSLVIIAVIISFVTTGTIIGVREGTIILALTVGKIMGVFHRPLEKPLKKLFY